MLQGEQDKVFRRGVRSLSMSKPRRAKMNTKYWFTAIFFLIVGILLVGCGSSEKAQDAQTPDLTGNWSGTTSQGHSIDFKVKEMETPLEDLAIYEITEMTYKITAKGSACDMTEEVFKPTYLPLPIFENEYFNYGVDGDILYTTVVDLSGRFSSESSLSGELTAFVIDQHCNINGKITITYDATKQ